MWYTGWGSWGAEGLSCSGHKPDGVYGDEDAEYIQSYPRLLDLAKMLYFGIQLDFLIHLFCLSTMCCFPIMFKRW